MTYDRFFNIFFLKAVCFKAILKNLKKVYNDINYGNVTEYEPFLNIKRPEKY